MIEKSEHKGTPLYPERPELGIDIYLNILNRPPEIVLSPEDKVAVLSIEKALTQSQNVNAEVIQYNGEEISLRHSEDETILGIERIWEMSVRETDFFMDYFDTEEGMRDLAKTLGWEPDQTVSVFLAKAQFVNDTGKQISAKIINEIAGRSRDFAQKRMADEFEEREFNSVDDVHNPRKMIVVRNPEVLVAKLEGLGQLKHYLHNFKLHFKDTSDDFSQAANAVINMHLKRLNQLLAEIYPDVASFLYQAHVSKSDDYKGLVEDIKDCIGKNKFRMYDKKDPGARVFERLDKFINGVGEKNSDGMYTAISPEVIEEVDKSKKEKHIHNKPVIDATDEDLKNITIDAPTFQDWFKRRLEHERILSNESEDTYDKDRQGTPKDGKWQAVIDPNRGSLAVNDKQRVILIPANFKRTLASINPAGAVPVFDHENTHVDQNENRRKLGLAITDNVRMDRSDIYSEAGAVARETHSQEEIFGHERGPNPHYLRAMQAKLAGGSLKDCMQAFFDSLCASDPKIDKRKAAEQAIDRTMRLFRNGGKYDDDSVHLTNSQPLLYLEQAILAEKLKKKGFEKLLFVNGVNLEVLADLHKVGLINLDSIIVPKDLPSEVILDEVNALIEKTRREEV